MAFPKIARQQFVGEMGKFTFSGVKFPQDGVPKIVKIGGFFTKLFSSLHKKEDVMSCRVNTEMVTGSIFKVVFK